MFSNTGHQSQTGQTNEPILGISKTKYGYDYMSSGGRTIEILYFKTVVFVLPASDEDKKSFVACTKADLVAAATRTDNPDIGEMAFGWWQTEGILKKGVGRVVCVTKELTRPLVDCLDVLNLVLE